MRLSGTKLVSMNKQIISKAASYVGGIVSMSLKLGKSRGAVSQWDTVPDAEVLNVSSLTGWRVTPHTIRPDLYPNPTDALPADIADQVVAGAWPPVGVVQRGLKRVAGDMDVAPGNLSCMLNDDSQRKLGTDDLEHYIQTQGDLTPVHFLIARYLGNQAAVEGAVLSRVQDQLADMVAMVAQLTKAQGVNVSRKK